MIVQQLETPYNKKEKIRWKTFRDWRLIRKNRESFPPRTICIIRYCNVCCLNVINTQSLHHKNDWTSKNLDYTLQFFMLLGVYYLLYCQYPLFHMKCLFTKMQSNIATHSNTIRIDQYCIVSPLVASEY